MMNKKGFQEEGMKFNVKMVSIIIFFIVVLAIVMIIVFPKLTAQQSADTSTSFGKYIWDILTGG
jgi:hypothetical protein